MVQFAFKNKHFIIVAALLVAIPGIVAVSKLPVEKYDRGKVEARIL